jgi:hypothetical protein
MQIFNHAKILALAAFLAIGISTAGVPVAGAGQARQSGEQLASSDLLPSEPSVSGEQIFADLIKHNELRNAELQRYSAVRIYAVSDLNGKVHTKETVRMDYVAPDKKTFVTIAEEGSGLVRRLVLNRLMESEVSTAAGKEYHDSSITPANYAFRILGQENLGAHHCFVVEAIPKRKDKYLFEGKIWIDSAEFAVVKIAGHPAKNLSFWITRADFVRQYERIGEFWLPVKDETFVDVKFYGKKILSIEHHIDSVNGVMSTALAARHSAAGSVIESRR